MLSFVGLRRAFAEDYGGAEELSDTTSDVAYHINNSPSLFAIEALPVLNAELFSSFSFNNAFRISAERKNFKPQNLTPPDTLILAIADAFAVALSLISPESDGMHIFIVKGNFDGLVHVCRQVYQNDKNHYVEVIVVTIIFGKYVRGDGEESDETNGHLEIQERRVRVVYNAPMGPRYDNPAFRSYRATHSSIAFHDFLIRIYNRFHPTMSRQINTIHLMEGEVDKTLASDIDHAAQMSAPLTAAYQILNSDAESAQTQIINFATVGGVIKSAFASIEIDELMRRTAMSSGLTVAVKIIRSRFLFAANSGTASRFFSQYPEFSYLWRVALFDACWLPVAESMLSSLVDSYLEAVERERLYPTAQPLDYFDPDLVEEENE